MKNIKEEIFTYKDKLSVIKAPQKNLDWSSFGLYGLIQSAPKSVKMNVEKRIVKDYETSKLL